MKIMAVPEEIQEKVLAEATSATPNYDINYGDERFGKVETDKTQAMTQLEQTYGGLINNSDKYYDAQIQASKDWADKQAQIQQDNTDFAIEQIEQQKDKANKDYLKEQSASYVDWQKQSNQYGTEAEKMASAGLTGTGFSESSQVSMYNTYQNRVATARESYNNAVLNYNNAIKDAQLQNNAALAEIAYNALQQQLELSLQGFQYKNQLILEQANKKTELENMYYNRYQDVLQQMNTENALKEDIRQYNETQKWQTEQAELERNHQLQRDELNRKFEAEQAELNKKHDFALLEAKTAAERKLAEEQHKRDMEKLKKQQEYEMAQLDKQLANEKALYSYKNSVSGVEITGNKGITKEQDTLWKQTANEIQNGSNKPVDTSNIIQLGYGPISAQQLDKLVKEGKVIEYEENGVIKFKNAYNGKNNTVSMLNYNINKKPVQQAATPKGRLALLKK